MERGCAGLRCLGIKSRIACLERVILILLYCAILSRSSRRQRPQQSQSQLKPNINYLNMAPNLPYPTLVNIPCELRQKIFLYAFHEAITTDIDSSIIFLSKNLGALITPELENWGINSVKVYPKFAKEMFFVAKQTRDIFHASYEVITNATLILGNGWALQRIL
jgi:hypothetical protein